MIQIGALGMTKVSASVLENFVPEYAVFGLPYLFRDEAHRQRVFHGDIGKRILRAGRAQGLRGLTYYDAASRSFYTKARPIESPADLAGLKIRTQESSLAIRMVRALGAAATPIAWGELYTALQQGVVLSTYNVIISAYPPESTSRENRHFVQAELRQSHREDANSTGSLAEISPGAAWLTLEALVFRRWRSGPSGAAFSGNFETGTPFVRARTTTCRSYVIRAGAKRHKGRRGSLNGDVSILTPSRTSRRFRPVRVLDCQ